MRRLAPLVFTLLGAALAFPAATMAGLPGAGLRNGGHPFGGRDQAVQPAGTAPAAGHAHMAGPAQNHGARCMCPDCQVRRAIEKAEGAPVVILGEGPASGVPCAACEASNSPGGLVPITQGEAPGYASVGGPGAGYASVGGPLMVAGEPTPIGVVRTNFAPPTQVDPSIAAFHRAASSPLGMSHQQAAGTSQVAPWVGTPGAGRTNVLGRMLGIRSPFSGIREAREARRAEAHAAIPMGQPAANARISELPASMVYGR